MKIEVKICGLTNLADAAAAIEAGADYLGFVLYPKSPRAVRPDQLRGIIGDLPPSCRAVGVFVNESRRLVEKVAEDCRLFAVQIHGDEPAGEFEGMPVRVWRAIRFAEGMAEPDPELWRAERYLIDAASAGVYGGSGAKADWSLAARVAAERPVMLAGGLTPDNVAEAIRTVKPLGVDVSGGVEERPGHKDLEKLSRFIRAARDADRS